MLSIHFAPAVAHLDFFGVVPGQEREERQEKRQKGTNLKK